MEKFDPSPEAEFFMENEIGHGFQIAFNVINQKARDLIMKAKERGYGIIARMPLQFGLLAKKFDESSKFAKNDHRHFRLNPDVLKKSLKALKEYWTIAGNYQTNPAQFSLNYILNHKEISTVIPGIKTREQAEENAIQTMQISEHDMLHVRKLYENKLKDLLEYMQHYG